MGVSIRYDGGMNEHLYDQGGGPDVGIARTFSSDPAAAEPAPRLLRGDKVLCKP